MRILPLPSTELNFDLFAVLSVKLWFSGFDTTRFHFFLLFLGIGPFIAFFFSFCNIILLLTVHILHYRYSKRCTIEHIKILKGTDYVLNGFDTLSRRFLIFFSKLTSTVVFTLSF